MSETPPAIVPGSIYTFYSYKGGVGRSMAVANVGVLLALAGKRVLLVDWDLEAPGLEAYFQDVAELEGDPKTVPGVVDLLEARVAARSLAWMNCRLRARFLGTSLDMISAGRRSDDYRARVQKLDWGSLYREHHVGNFVDELREEWRANYDLILIDSRTGITDPGDICTALLPDAVVLMFVTNRQNIEGINAAMMRAVAARRKLPVNRNKLLGIPLPARDEVYNEYEKSLEWKSIFATEFGYLFKEWLPREVSPQDALHKLFIPYVTNWSFGERIPVLESARETQDPTSIGGAYRRLANLLASGLDWYCVEGNATVHELQGAQVELLRERERAQSLEVRARAAARARRRALVIAMAAVLVAVVVSYMYLRNRAPVSTELFDGARMLREGQSEDALRVFDARSVVLEERLPEAAGDPLLLRDIAVTHIWKGDALRALGRTAEGLEAFDHAKVTRQAILAKNPNDFDSQRELSVAYGRIGEILKAQGKLEKALESFRADRAIMEKLAEQDPANTDWQLALAASYNRIGGALETQGKLDEALESFRADKAIMEELTAQEPGNTQFEDDLATSHLSIGGILLTQGRFDEALESFRADRAITEKRAAQDPADTNWQRGLAVSYNKIGDVLEAQGKLDEALASFRAENAIAEELTARDPANTDWQQELAASHNMIGAVLEAQGKLDEALASFRADKRIMEKLAAHDPTHADWQEELATAHSRIGRILTARADFDAAEAELRQAQRLLETLVLRDPSNGSWQHTLSYQYKRLGILRLAQGKSDEALSELVKAERILELSLADPSNAEWRRDHIEVSRLRAAALLRKGDVGASSDAVEHGLALYDEVKVAGQVDAFLTAEYARLLIERGKVLERMGDEVGAQKSSAEAEGLLNELVRANPSRTEWQLDLERIRASTE